MENPTKFRKIAKIKWYRCQVDPALMSQLMKCSDLRGFLQAGGHLALWATTGTLAFLAFSQIRTGNWFWTVPLLLVALFAHGTIGSTLASGCHEMSHKTPFKTKSINDFFLKVYSFFAWWNQVWFRPSHVRHHQVTVHTDYDGEVVLPMKISAKDWQFWLGLFAWNPLGTWGNMKWTFRRATGRLDNDWYEFVMPEADAKLRRDHRNWARFTLLGHASLAAIFIATGHWFLIVLVNIGTQYCGWLSYVTGLPQHYGLSSNVPDHRICCRTYTCSWLPGFLYWNMQYHVEHHMFPAVPFFNLPRLRKAIEADLPPAPHGLRAVWKELLEIHRQQQKDPHYALVPKLPQSVGTGTRAEDDVLESEAALST